MTRQEQLVFCKKCTNRDFNITEGVLCKLTGKKADFEDTCPDYRLDKKMVIKGLPSKKIKPNEKRAAMATTMIWAVLAINLFALVSNYFQYDLLQELDQGIDVTEAELTANDLRVGLISVLYLLIYIISGITFIQWFRRAYNNLAARTKIDHNEGWAAGAWFVPIISLFRPYTIMKELFVKTNKLLRDRSGLATEGNELTLVGLWWALWIIVGYIGNYSIKMIFKEDTIESLLKSTIADMATSVMEIPIGILAIWMVVTLAKKESQLLGLEKEELKKMEAA